MRSVAAGFIITLIAAAAPAAASGSAFTAPRAITSLHGKVDSPSVAITPSGRTAVMWRTFGRRARDFQYVVAIGSTPRALGKPTIVKAGAAVAGMAGTAQLIALPTGQFAACFADDALKGTAVAGCSFSQPDGSFGAFSVLRRVSWKLRPYATFAAGATGRVVATISTLARGGRRQLTAGVLDSSGLVGPLQSIATLDASAGAQLASLDDGTVALSYDTPTGATDTGAEQPHLRLLAPGATQFAADTPVPIGDRPSLGTHFSLTGGRTLLIEYAAGPSTADSTYREFVVERRPDGSFSAPLALPAPNVGGFFFAATSAVGSAPLVITNAVHRDATDCSALISGVIRVASPTAGGATAPVQLSAPKQIAIDPQLVSLADGTTIAIWDNSVNDNFDARVEVAIREPGAATFSPPQALPGLAASDAGLAAGGNQAAIVWIVGSLPDGPSHVVVSALTASAPYAPSAPLPKHPAAPCE